MKGKITAVAVAAVIGGTIAFVPSAGAVQRGYGATWNAERPTKVVGLIRGTATFSKVRSSRVDRIDVRLLRSNRVVAQRTFLVPRAGRLYRAAVTYTCRTPLRASYFQTQIRPVLPSGEAGVWSTSPYLLKTC